MTAPVQVPSDAARDSAGADAEGLPGGRLSVVGTPIGNMQDITLRALTCLKRAAVVVAEDTRRTRKLLAHHGIDTPLRALHAHSSERDVARCLALLQEGRHLALVTDAGTPLISDPGAALVAAASAAGVAIEAIPGPSAVVAALSVCGLPFDGFRFVGFAPRTGSKRKAWLASIAGDRAASVFFESPARLATTLAELAACLPAERAVAVCRELTKLHEEVVRGSAAELAQHFAGEVRGEITVVVSSGVPQTPSASSEDDAQQSLQAQIDALLERGASARDIVRQLARELGHPRRALYAQVLARSEARAKR